MRLGKPGDDPAAALGPVLRPLPKRALGGAAVLALLLSVHSSSSSLSTPMSSVSTTHKPALSTPPSPPEPLP